MKVRTNIRDIWEFKMFINELEFNSVTWTDGSNIKRGFHDLCEQYILNGKTGYFLVDYSSLDKPTVEFVVNS